MLPNWKLPGAACQDEGGWEATFWSDMDRSSQKMVDVRPKVDLQTTRCVWLSPAAVAQLVRCHRCQSSMFSNITTQRGETRHGFLKTSKVILEFGKDSKCSALVGKAEELDEVCTSLAAAVSFESHAHYYHCVHPAKTNILPKPSLRPLTLRRKKHDNGAASPTRSMHTARRGAAPRALGRRRLYTRVVICRILICTKIMCCIYYNIPIWYI